MLQKYITSHLLKKFPHIVHGFGTRALGNDLRTLSAALGVAKEQLFCLKQIHSNQVVCADEKIKALHPAEGDALVTNRQGVVIGVQTADCLPILICEHQAGVVAAVHAGWRGLLAGIIQNTVAIMAERYGCVTKNMCVALGPCICMQHYEVADKIAGDFTSRWGALSSYEKKPGPKQHLNLAQTAQNMLKELGIRPENTDHISLCTYERADLFHSWRREQVPGRQFGFIGIRNGLL